MSRKTHVAQVRQYLVTGTIQPNGNLQDETRVRPDKLFLNVSAGHITGTERFALYLNTSDDNPRHIHRLNIPKRTVNRLGSFLKDGLPVETTLTLTHRPPGDEGTKIVDIDMDVTFDPITLKNGTQVGLSIHFTHEEYDSITLELTPKQTADFIDITQQFFDNPVLEDDQHPDFDQKNVQPNGTLAPFQKT